MKLAVLFNAIFSCYGSLSIAASLTAPADVIGDVHDFALQIPTNPMSTISNSNLKTYSSKYFYTSSDGARVVMFAPENGGLTPNGSGPRTEFSGSQFTFSGTHTMSYTTRVIATGPTSSVCIGQVKGDSYSAMHNNGTVVSSFLPEQTKEDVDASVRDLDQSGLGASCLIVVELMYDSSRKMVVSSTRDTSCNSVHKDVGSFNFGEDIHVTLKVSGTNVYVSTNKQTLPAYDYSHWSGHNYQMNFKAGVYTQGTGSSSTAGGKVEMHGMSVTHSSGGGGDCSWIGHCAGDPCSTYNDCDGDMTCINGKCG